MEQRITQPDMPSDLGTCPHSPRYLGVENATKPYSNYYGPNIAEAPKYSPWLPLSSKQAEIVIPFVYEQGLAL